MSAGGATAALAGRVHDGGCEASPCTLTPSLWGLFADSGVAMSCFSVVGAAGTASRSLFKKHPHSPGGLGVVAGGMWWLQFLYELVCLYHVCLFKYCLLIILYCLWGSCVWIYGEIAWCQVDFRKWPCPTSLCILGNGHQEYMLLC
jgi:hypothetical protein